MRNSKHQRVSEKDAQIILNELTKKPGSLTFIEDYAGGSEAYISEEIVNQLIKKLTRP